MVVMARRYRKRRRAELEEETRLRITRALVALHGTIGPARTTIGAVAAEAGVQRATVYRHFPDEPSMFAACSGHWSREHPLPDLAAWAGIPDPGRRLRTALGELYAFYGRNEAMLTNIFRDASLVPALEPSVTEFRAWFDRAGDALARGLPKRRLVRAAIAHALAFGTWTSLTRTNALPEKQAVSLMATLVETASTRPR